MITLAKINEQGSEYDKAISVLQVALEMAGPMSRESAQIWTILGTIYGYLGPMEKRIAAHKQALAINIALEDRLQTAECHNLLGTIYKDSGDYEEAIHHTQQALAIAEEMDHRESISRFMHRIGVIYWRQENMALAQEWYERALAIATEINHKRLITIISGSRRGARPRDRGP
jgi:tetratricopeptide (TPR) repeat protein